MTYVGRSEKIGLWEAVSIGIGGMIGGGIFAVLGLAAEYAGYGTPFAFLLAGFAALLTSYSYARFSVAIPSEGGTVEFIAAAFRNGLFVGAVNLLLLLSYVVMLSLYAHAFGAYFAALFGWGFWPAGQIFATAILLAFAWLNLRGARTVGNAEDIIVATKLAILLLFVVVGLHGVRWGKFTVLSTDWTSIVAGGFLIFLAYEGFELIANTARDIENPLDNIPRAYYISVIAVIIVYVLVAVVALGHLEPHALVEAKDYALAVAAEPFLGRAGFVLIALAALLSTASAINATLYGSARIAYSLAKDGVIPDVRVMNWGESAEGLFIVTLLSIVMVNTINLSGISLLGSAGFLFIFGLVNLGAWIMHRKIRANPTITATATLFSFAALATLLYKVSVSHPGTVTLFFMVFASAFVLEAVYRSVRRRTVHLRFWRE
ncbi:MAG: amino acid permease [Candidatus Diapherotrites archaeon]|nr:amino acid permease [Candidatus Diapherotrites archaeon]